MTKEIKEKIRQSLLLDESERILSLVQVVDYAKYQQQLKKLVKDETAASLVAQSNTFYMLASIKAAENDSTPLLYLMKLDDKTNEFKLKATWQLGELRTITSLDHNAASSQPSFLIEFEASGDQIAKYTWRCEGRDERQEFLTTLWKLSDQFLQSSQRPDFKNFQYQSKKKKDEEENKSEQGDDQSVNQNAFEISKSEEESLMKLMDECNFASANAENFVQRLQAELLVLDTSNIESIMNSEENTIKLIEMLDEAVAAIEKIDVRLKDYEDKISAVGDAVRIVGERDNVIQTQQLNQHALLEMLEEMLLSLEFPKSKSDLLSECNLSNETHINRCVSAANELLEIIKHDFPAGLKKMKAYEEQIKFLEHLKLRFCNQSSNHLKNAIGYTINKHLDSYKIVDNSLTSLPSHKTIHDELIKFKDLMSWIARSGCALNDQDQRITYFNLIKKNYLEEVKRLYAGEIVPFCYCAKAKINKNEKAKPNSSMENLKFIRSLDKNHSGDFFSIKIDQSTKETLKMVFIKLMNQLSVSVQNEQVFCQEFFASRSPKDANTPKSLTSSTITNTSFTESSKSDPKYDLIILNEMFSNMIEEQVRSIIECTIRTENLMVIFVYSDLLYRVLVSHNQRQFMHQPLVSLLRMAKEKCDEFTNLIKVQIREYKVNKKEKIGVLRYVSYFEEFVKEAEHCWEPIKERMYEKLCIIYQMIVDEIFKGIDTIANESQKTPPEVVKFQNYYQMNHIMRSINGLKESTKYAKDQYASSRQNYVKEHFGRPLDKLSAFFDKVQQKLERGIKHEDISYQLELSANNLREIIREYPAKEVKKGLDNLYNKVQKHLVEHSNLVEVVWRDMSDEFLRQYQNYEQLIRTCYPNQRIALEFTEQDICSFFQEIAQSH